MAFIQARKGHTHPLLHIVYGQLNLAPGIFDQGYTTHVRLVLNKRRNNLDHRLFTFNFFQVISFEFFSTF